MVLDDPPGSEISSFLRSVSEVDVATELVRNEELGSLLNFSDCEASFEQFRRLAVDLSPLNWADLPRQSQRDVWNSLLGFRDSFWAIREFSSTTHGKDERDELANSFLSGLEGFKLVISPLLAYLLWESGDYREREKELDRSVQEISVARDATFQELDAMKSAAERALLAIQGVSAQSGVSHEAQAFSEAASRYELLARRWLKGSIASALATILVGVLIVVFWNSASDLGTAAVLQAVLGRAAVVAVLSYATVTVVRLYRSNSHLAVVNRHREDALKTFRTFVEGADTDETRRQILLAAAHAAFGQTATGLIGEKADGGNTLEVLEGLFGRSVRSS